MKGGERGRPGVLLPLPRTLPSLVLHRLERLPAQARKLLLIASAMAAPTVDLVREPAGAGAVASSLGRAEQPPAIEIRGRPILFAHPSPPSAGYSSASHA